MGDDDDATSLIHQTPHKGGAVHAKDILFESKDQKVCLFSGYFDTGENEKVMPLAQLRNIAVIPKPVMLGETDGIKIGLLGINDEFIRGQITVLGLRCGMRMKVNEHLVYLAIANEKG